MRAQFSIDFFLVLSIILAFLVPLYSVAVLEGGRARFLNSAVITKNSVDSVAYLVDYASLGGVGTSVSATVFVPSEASCFFTNESTKKIYCSLSSLYLEGSKNKVESQALLVSLPVVFNCGNSGVSPGWHPVTASVTDSYVAVNCA